MKRLYRLIQPLALALLAAIMVSCGEKKDESSSAASEQKTEVAGESSIEVHSAAECPTSEGCFICDASKRDAKRLWCKEHDRYEDRCFLCHPELEEKGRIYCSEHGVYEDECYLCHPELKGNKDGVQTPMTSGSSIELMCNEHGVPEAECAICQPQLAEGLKPGQSLKIRVASADAIDKVGVKVSRPQHSVASDTVKAYATVDYNQNRVARITPLVEGIVYDVSVAPGQQVEAGHALGLIHSSQFAEAKSKFLVAVSTRKLKILQVERERQLAAKKISAASDLETAEAEAEVAEVKFVAARQSLLNLDLEEKDIERLIEGGRPDAMYGLKAPFAGTIVDRKVAAGERVKPGDAIFILTDLSSMWLDLSIPARYAAPLRVGMPVRAQFADLPEMVIEAKLIWISSAVDPKTRRIKARAIVTNPPVGLRKGLYGEASIQLSEDTPSLAVPTTAIQKIDGVPFVFVRKNADLYAATRVTLAGESPSGLTSILQGLSEDDLVVTTGSYILRSEFLKSQLGAGCVDD